MSSKPDGGPAFPMPAVFSPECGTMDGAGPLGDSVSTLPAFIIAHRKCPVRIVDEHLKHDWMEPRTGREWEEVYTEWTQENRKSLIDAAGRDGRWL